MQNQRFQALNAAYRVLSDPELRADYDSLQYEEPYVQNYQKIIEPIRCSACGKVTAQPRSVVFYKVVSLFVVTTKTPTQGIYCSSCARSVSLRSSFVSALFGWWGFPWGPIWTISSIIGNAIGGRHSIEVDEKLYWYNCLAFLSKENLAIAYALAQRLVGARDAEIAGNAALLMAELQGKGVPRSSPKLKDPWRTSPVHFMKHVALLALLPWSIACLTYLDSRQSGSIPTSVLADFEHTYSPPAQSPTLPAPSSLGKPPAIKVPTCAFAPYNGQILTQSSPWKNKGHSVEINNGTDGNAIIKLRDAYTNSMIMSFFVTKGLSASAYNIPDGAYRVQFAFGDELQSDCRSFVHAESAGQFPGVEELRTEFTPTQIIRSQLSYTLYPVPNGNVRPETIDISKFDAD